MWQLRRNTACRGGVGTRASEGEGVGRGRWARPTRARARAQAQLDEVSQVRAWSGLAATAATSGFLQEARNLLVYAERAMEASGFRGSTLAWMNRMTAQALLAAEEGNEEWFHTVLESVEPHVERAEQTPIIVLAEIHMARMAHGCEAGLGVLRRRLPQIEAIFHTTSYMRATLVATRARKHPRRADGRQ